jgi:multidrug efflux pump
MLVLLGATIALNVFLYIVIPKGFFPQQDTGIIQGGIQADQSISFAAMKPKLEQLAAIVQADPAVATVSGFTNGGNRCWFFVTLKPLRERKVSAQTVINRLRPETSVVTGAQLFLFPAQDIRVGGRGGDASYEYTLQADTVAELRAWTPKIRAAMLKVKEITDVSLDSGDHGLQTMVVYDRDTLSRLGLTVAKVDAALYDAFGQRQISTLFKPLNQYHVVMGVAPDYLESPAALKDVYVMNNRGERIPFSAFAHVERGNAPLAVNHQGQFVSTTVSFNLAPGVTLTQAGEAITRAIDELGVPSSIIGSFQGSAKAFEKTMQSQPYLILAALLAVYIVLGILYEDLIHPITILSTLPSAGVGALLALMVFGTEFTLIALIGVLLLIGIVKKNAIMMIDFAIAAERRDGLSPRDAIFRACLLRFRPIMMTTMAALLGALPLAIALGEGSELRQPLGISIVGGLIFSQVLTLYTTPVVYLYFDRLRLWFARRRERRRAVATTEPAPHAG